MQNKELLSNFTDLQLAEFLSFYKLEPLGGVESDDAELVLQEVIRRLREGK